jgi:hypothetical protein
LYARLVLVAQGVQHVTKLDEYLDELEAADDEA